MNDVIAIVLTTVLVFCVQQLCAVLWDKLSGQKGREKIKKGTRK